MRIAVTGTPGVGKTSACAHVKSLPVYSVNALAKEFEAVSGYDRKRRTKEVDARKLARRIAKMDGDMVLEGHFSHMLGVDIAVVLRCSPRVLAARLNSKGWAVSKVAENIEAEAVDVILVEAVGKVPVVCEVDTTKRTPEQVGRIIDRIAKGGSQKYPVGHVDWSREVLSWF
jgi:adenylate kinase